MSMVHQFGKRLPRPVQVWVLDTVPGDVWATAGDHPRDTINHCVSIEMPVPSRKFLVDSLTGTYWAFPKSRHCLRTLRDCLLRTTSITNALFAEYKLRTWPERLTLSFIDRRRRVHAGGRAVDDHELATRVYKKIPKREAFVAAVDLSPSRHRGDVQVLRTDRLVADAGNAADRVTG